MYIRASNDNSAKIQQLTDSVSFISDMYEEQKKIDDTLIGKINNLNERQAFFKEKCMIYERRMSDQAAEIDDLEQYGRRNCLLLHGVPENTDVNVREDTDSLFIDTIAAHLQVKFLPEDLDRSHRLGAKKNDRPRPIIVKFARYNRRKVAFNLKKKFKGSNFILTESLTRKRVIMLDDAKKKFGTKNVWSMDGEVYAYDGKTKINVKEHFAYKIVFKVNQPVV